MAFHDVSLVAKSPNASAIAILEARSRAVPFAQNHRYQNVNIYMYSDVAVNHGHGRIGIYNYGAELWSAYDLHIEADIPLFFSNQNDLAVNSTEQLVTAPQSMAGVVVGGESSLIAYGGPAIALGGDVGMLDFGQTFIAENSTFTANHSPFAIVSHGQVRGLRYAGNIENLNQVLLLEGPASGLDLSGTVAAASGAPVIALHCGAADPVISDSSIRVRQVQLGVKASLFGSKDPAQCRITSSLIDAPLGGGLGVDASSGGNLIMGRR